jgi:uncharacterized protein (DUF1778 family)
MLPSVKRRDERLEVRLTPHAKTLLKRAADAEDKSVSAFVLDKSIEAATAMLADRRDFRLSANQFDAFVAALDTPPKPRRRLAELLAAPSAIE